MEEGTGFLGASQVMVKNGVVLPAGLIPVWLLYVLLFYGLRLHPAPTRPHKGVYRKHASCKLVNLLGVGLGSPTACRTCCRR